MTYNEFTQKQLEYEFLYNLRDQTILFLKMSDGARAEELLGWLERTVGDMAKELSE